MGVDAECIHCRLPATRNPVSSKWATADPTIRATIPGITFEVIWAVIRFTQDTRVDAAIFAPNRSASAWQVRDFDRNWPWNRYTPTPPSRDPYCTGAFTPAGAGALVITPQQQAREINRCSVTSRRSGGRSNTCRRSLPTTAAPSRPAPHPQHTAGS